MRQTMIGFICGIAVCLGTWVLLQHEAIASADGRGNERGTTAGVVTCAGDLNGDGVVDVSDLLILLSNWGPCVDAESCEGNCGGAAPSGCYCDESCHDFADCCDDVCDHCEHEPCTPSDSCAGNCGGSAPSGCYCDEACHDFADCCDDVCDHCDHEPCAPSDSCADNCGGSAPSGCYCDEACHDFADCCADVCDHCDHSAC